jgi:AGZA family xanthine/uracil permease-like MFS transporter
MGIEGFFKLKAHGTTVKTELTAGLITFMTMAYIIAVNPAILAQSGMDKGAVMTATILSAAVATLIMALYAKLPFALAPGMGLNAFFTYTVCLGMGKSWQFALTAVFLSGLIFMLLTVFKIRTLILEAIPVNLKKAISAGIGLFIAVIGLGNAGIVEKGAVLLQIGNITGGHEASLALIGILFTAILLALNVKGALLFGIIATTLLGIPMGVTDLSSFSGFVSLPASVAPLFLQFEWREIVSAEMALTVVTFVFLNLFDTMGTLVGVSTKARMITATGHIPHMREAFLSDAWGSIIGACLGSSPVVTYVESAAGVAQGGRTGLTSVTVALLFLLALFFSPLFLVVPAAATAPALFLVGFFMLSPLAEIDFNNFSEAVPAFFTLLMMPLSYSISEGIAFGIISYVVIKLFSGRARDVKPITWFVALFFVIIQFYFHH